MIGKQKRYGQAMKDRVQATVGRQLTALVVDDHESWRRVLTEVLLALGLGPIRSAPSAEEARAFLASQEVDMVVCDLHMPDEDGLSFVRWARASSKPQLRNIPIILLSGEPTLSIYQRVRCCGAHYFVSKPVTVNSLAKAIMHSIRAPTSGTGQTPCAGEGDVRCPLMKSAPAVATNRADSAAQVASV